MLKMVFLSGLVEECLTSTMMKNWLKTRMSSQFIRRNETGVKNNSDIRHSVLKEFQRAGEF